MALKWATPKKRRLRWYDVYVMNGNEAIYRSYRGGCWLVRVRAVSMQQAKFYVKRGTIAADERESGIVEFIGRQGVQPGSEWPWSNVR
jgi:hypothetical protein